jgi:hypothetical protein
MMRWRCWRASEADFVWLLCRGGGAESRFALPLFECKPARWSDLTHHEARQWRTPRGVGNHLHHGLCPARVNQRANGLDVFVVREDEREE